MAEAVAAEVEAKPRPEQSEIKNFKEEMNRKFGNLEKSTQTLITQLQQVVETIPTRKGVTPATEEGDKDPIEDIWYEPAKAAKAVEDRATNRTLAIIQKQQEEQAKKGNVIQQLYREYPELQDYDHPLTTKAIEIFDKMKEDEKASPISYRLAVKEAAEELDLKPKAKRKAKEEEDDDVADDAFTLKGGSSSSKRERKSAQLDPRTVEFAKLVGLNMDDETTVANIKRRAERKNWMRYE